jgi:hypothetical protein
MIPSARMHVSGKPPERAHDRPSTATRRGARSPDLAPAPDAGGNGCRTRNAGLLAALVAGLRGAGRRRLRCHCPAGDILVWIAVPPGLWPSRGRFCAVSAAFHMPSPRKRWTGWTGRCRAARSPRFSTPSPSVMTTRRRSRSGRSMSPAWRRGHPRRARRSRTCACRPAIPTRCAMSPRPPGHGALFGTLGRVADVGDAVTIGPGAASASGPSWEGWVEPPIYTGLPSLYLNDIAAESFETPEGSRISLRFYGNPTTSPSPPTSARRPPAMRPGPRRP